MVEHFRLSAVYMVITQSKLSAQETSGGQFLLSLLESHTAKRTLQILLIYNVTLESD